MGSDRPFLVRVIGFVAPIIAVTYLIILELVIPFVFRIFYHWGYLSALPLLLLAIFSLITMIAVMRYKPSGRIMMIILALIIIGINLAHLYNSYFLLDRHGSYDSLGGSSAYLLGMPYINLINVIIILFFTGIIIYFSMVKEAFAQDQNVQ